MRDVDIADDTFMVADPERVARVVSDPTAWRGWWPDLDPVVTEDRGVNGLRWTVTGALSGSMEVWLEPVGDGVVVHYYLRARVEASERAARALVDRRRRAWKASVHALKDRLEQGREPGQPRHQAPDVKEMGRPAE